MYIRAPDRTVGDPVAEVGCRLPPLLTEFAIEAK
jgi:hypothetical protein